MSFTHRHTRIWQWERNKGILTPNVEVDSWKKTKTKNKSDSDILTGTQRHVNVLIQVSNVLQCI